MAFFFRFHSRYSAIWVRRSGSSLQQLFAISSLLSLRGLTDSLYRILGRFRDRGTKTTSCSRPGRLRQLSRPALHCLEETHIRGRPDFGAPWPYRQFSKRRRRHIRLPGPLGSRNFRAGQSGGEDVHGGYVVSGSSSGNCRQDLFHSNIGDGQSRPRGCLACLPARHSGRGVLSAVGQELFSAAGGGASKHIPKTDVGL